MFRNLKMFFRYHKVERDGSVAILILVILVTAGVQFYSHFYEPEPIDQSKWAMLLDSLNRKASLTEDSSVNTILTSEKFRFNPNTLSDSGYTALGFKAGEIKTLRKYMGSGAVFNKKEDFSRLYFLSDTEFHALAPYIELPDSLPGNQNPRYNQPPWTDSLKWSDTARTKLFRYNPIICDLNHADTLELKELPGIGSYYAREIVRYRDELGGFFDVGQLLEIYKMKIETIDRVAPRISIDYKAIRKIPVNTATAQEMAAHPYITMRLANQIINLRETRGRIENMQTLCETGLLNANLCLKLAPYFQF